MGTGGMLGVWVRGSMSEKAMSIYGCGWGAVGGWGFST